MTRLSVVIPVKDGAEHLGAVLGALSRERADEVLVIDSGSRDGSQEIARAAGVEVVEIPPGEFGHGRTRNLGAERTSGELICFLTQDAVPLPGWLSAYEEAFALEPRIGAAFGPHLPRPDSSPAIARELTEFFNRFSPNGSPALQGEGDDAFLSNVNACYLRRCWEQVRFPDVPYAEDQAFARAMLAAGWLKAYHPAAAVQHAHDYGLFEFMRRYFDEYRGLRETTGHVEPFSPRAVPAHVAADLRWMREHGYAGHERARWALRSALHHGGRRVFSALGSRHERLPAPLQRALSLERRGSTENGPVPRGRPVPARSPATPYQELTEVLRDGPAPLEEALPGSADRDRLHVAVVIPPFKLGSGGHNTIFQLTSRLERMGHTCSIWVHDPRGQHESEWPAVLRRRIVEGFAPVRAPVFKGLDQWYGADVVVATGWETVYPVLLLPHCKARVYLVNDHEPEFFATSAERLWAERTYSFDLYCISASKWLADLLAERYGARGTWFRLGVDHRNYRPQPVERRRDTVIFYARVFTPRRAVPLGVLALQELWRRRPELRFVAFGQGEPLDLSFPYESLGVASPGQLAWNYSEATVGLCMSLTNYSLVPQEMMGCGLPCVDVAGGSSEAEFGADGPVELAEPDPIAIADAIGALLSDEERWRRRSDAGLQFVGSASWDLAARQVERALREALREREGVVASA
jgi:glycosyltransferase involved in cell wall biosynthesis